MYFPIIRGKTFDLLAIKELKRRDLLGDKIIPIIEPDEITNHLINTLKTYVNNKSEIGLIMESRVSELPFGDYIKEEKNEEFGKLLESPYIIKIFFSDKDIYRKTNNQNSSAIIWDDIDFDYYDESESRKKGIKYNLGKDSSFLRDLEIDGKVALEDSFDKQPRNVDYQGRQNYLFSNLHLQKNSGGFGDYTIVGKHYSRNGGPARAVAIHIVHFDNNDYLRISHYVSDSNDTTDDVNGKIGEALTHLVNDPILTDVESHGLNELRKLKETGKSTNLAKIKQFSIMHHLEIMNEFLEKRK